jgi:hypothetical protein
MDLQFLEQETEIQLCWTDVGLRMLTHYNGWSKHLEGWCLLSCCSGKCPSDLCPESPNSAAIKLAGMWKNEMVQATVGTSVFPIITTTVAQWVSSDWLNCSLVFSFFGYSKLCFMSTVFCRPLANVIATQEERPTEWSRVICLKQGDGEMYVIFGWWRCFCLGFMLWIFQCVTDQCFWSNVFLQVFCNVCRQLAYSVTLWRRGAYFSTWHREIGYFLIF